MKKRPVHRSAPSGDEKTAGGPFDADALPRLPPAPLPSIDEPPAFRPLRVYAFDPSLGRTAANVTTIPVRYEKLRPGPVGARVAVIDYDAPRNCFYDPVDLDDPHIAMRGGLDPSESDPRFHQQMAYAVTSETLRRVESALGRTVLRRTAEGTAPLRLYVYPHAMVAANAYWVGGPGSMLFGYFRAPEGATGGTFPGQTIFTCLSHDVVVHTALHALVDALRPDLTAAPEGDDIDVPAFLEGFADGMSLFLHFSYREAVLDTIQRTAGSLHRSVLGGSSSTAVNDSLIQAEVAVGNPLLAMGNEFGEAMGRTGGLRSALGRPPDPEELKRVTEPHDRGAILVAALFDAFFTVYVRRSLDLLNIYRAGGGRLSEGDLPAPLAERLFAETDAVARRLFDTCVRALDYCPPPPFVLGDYLRACITADFAYAPTDAWGVREALMHAFSRRGMKPSTVSFFSEEALRWPRMDANRLISPGPSLPGPSGAEPANAQQNQKRLRAFVADNAAALGLDPRVGFVIHPLEFSRLITADGRVEGTLSTQVLQKRGKKTRGRGVSLVFDASGHLRHAIPSTTRSR